MNRFWIVVGVEGDDLSLFGYGIFLIWRTLMRHIPFTACLSFSRIKAIVTELRTS